MKIKNLLPVTLLSLCVCGAPYSNEDILFILSLPQAEDLKLTIESGRSGQALRTAQDMCPVEQATTYLKIRVTAQSLNTSLLGILGIVDVVTDYPPTERDDDFRRWGPWTDKGISYRVDVRRMITPNGEQFSYEMNGKRSDEDEWRVLLSGQLLEGVTSADGRGNMNLDFDQLRALNPSTNEQGRLEVDYDTRGQSLGLGLVVHSSSITVSSSVTEDIRKSQFGDTDIVARYGYTEDEKGVGSFRIEGVLDSHEESDPMLNKEEFITVSARWREDQRGRAETTIEGGDVRGFLRVSECWDSSFLVTYREGQFNRFTGICGTTESCPAEYQTADFLR